VIEEAAQAGDEAAEGGWRGFPWGSGSGFSQ
jgi:hypothetical protein